MYQALFKQGRWGFSFLELLAVVAIFGIVAAITVPHVSTTKAFANQRVHEQNIATLNSAVERYYVAEGNWPVTLAELDAEYLPTGVPAVPTEKRLSYSIDNTTHRVVAN
ncbi:prepilin-type N-terminal cleavage/methylation domain-containing protein [Bremerella cremea]|uniref:Prepilin-type N-terminal cleavage/methylation domain-containing protein n=1 Tax=Bremerella cremea TaxID=1031537 RepID=A0A368KVI7_9BACT|nr:type II secretion system protein [Bremerella cremea]RCS54316.1 prepilin-type N-terminal cleavage/methylation domain-containing protein [Bremerella cremea]